MAIKEAIELDGADEVKAQIADLVKTAQGLQDKLNQTGAAQTGTGIEQFVVNVRGATGAMNEHGQSVSGVTEAYHILAPIMREVGVSLGEFRGFAILARGGIEGLAAAAGGALIIALATVEDAAKRVKLQLSDLFQSQALGGQAFDALSQTAAKLGTSVASLQPGLEALTIAWQKFQATTQTGKFVAFDTSDLPVALGGVVNLTKAYQNFLEILRGAGQDQATATAAANAFFTALQNGGKITADVLSKLPVGAVDQLAQALGRGGQQTQVFIEQVRKAPIEIDKLVPALDRFTTQSDKAFDSKAIITYKDVLGQIGQTLLESFGKLSGVSFSDFLVNELKGVQKGIQDTVAEFDKLNSIVIKPPTFDDIKKAFADLWSFLTASSTQAGFDINTGIQQGLQQSPPDFSAILTAFQSTGQQLVAAAQSIWDNLKSILSQAIVVPVSASLEGAAPQFARGGLVAGPGTGTSDSIMALLSNREFVVNARSTEFYGPGFFAALNAMLVPRDLLPGFAMGGLVKAIASTPGQSARTPIVLNIDRHTFNMTATDDVASALQTLSVSEQMSAAGRSPGWRRS